MTRGTYWLGFALATTTVGLLSAGCGSGSKSRGGFVAPPATSDDHGNDAATATALGSATSIAATVSGALGSPGDVDWFSVDLAAGSSYEFRTTNLANGADTILRLIDTDGTTQLDENDDIAPTNSASLITYQATAAGTYYLEVRDAKGTIGGSYELEVTPAGGAGPGALAAAVLADVDGSNGASQGDTITLTFGGDVALGGAFDPAAELDLPVAGDSFGAGATLAAGASATEVVITLGAAPVFRLTGTFDPANVAALDPSGIAIGALSRLTAVVSGTTPSGTVDVDSPLTPGFAAGATLNTPRGLHTATALTDGRVLVVGGAAGQNLFSRSEILDAGVATYTDDAALGGNPGGFMGANGIAVARYSHTATRLPSGQVLIAGGFGVEQLDAAQNPVFEDLTSIHSFDPATNAFTQVGVLAQGRREHYATLLPNGMVLIAGGFNAAVSGGTTLRSAELFDPVLGTVTALPDMNVPRQAGTADMLGQNVLYTAGLAFAVDPNNPPAVVGFMGLQSEVWDMQAGAFAMGSAPLTDRRWHGSGPHPSGDVLILGGADGAAPPGLVTSVERCDQVTGAFTAVGNLQVGRIFPKTATVGDDLLVVGGVDLSTGAPVEISVGELYDVVNNVSEQYQMQSARNSHAVCTLPNGKVVVTGGFAGGTTTTVSINGTPVPACEEFVIP